MRNLLGLTFFLSLFGSFTAACRTFSRGSEPAQAPAEVLDAAPSTGRYVGFAKPEQVAAKLATVMHLVRLGEVSGVVHYRAILRFAAGNLGGPDDGSVYVSDLSYNRSNARFDWAGLPTGIALTKIQATPGAFSGTLTSATDKASVDFAVHLDRSSGSDESSDPTLPLLPAATASYSGICPDHVSGLQVESSRWRNETGALFGGVVLTGRLLQAGAGVCSNDQPCLKKAYNTGTYDPLNGSIVLGLGPDKLVCSVLKDQLRCGECLLSAAAISPYGVLEGPHGDTGGYARTQHLAKSPSSTTPAHLPGTFYGYLHHELTDTYQLIALNLQVERALQAAAAHPVATKLQVSGVASAYFGEGDSSELIAYRFNPLSWSGTGPLLLDGDGEVFVVIDEWDDSRIVGTWYSKTRGRIGSIELQVKLVPALAASLKSMHKLSHAYTGGNWDFDLAATANLSEQVTDFYPLKINGWAKEKGDQARRRTIKDGSYDFYAGRVALRLDDGRIAVGTIKDDGLEIFWPGKPHQGAPLSDGTQMFKPTPGSL
jgi:hypothetical protein